MDDTFDIPVTYNNKELAFKAAVQNRGYTYRLAVDVFGTEVLFEPDEERNFRAMVENPGEADKLDAGLIQAIAEVLEMVMK